MFTDRRFTRLALIAVFSLAALHAVAAADEAAGALIYKSKCASCHGQQGEGSKKYKQRLEGERSLSQLTELIAKTMPESNPGSLSAKEAELVSAYVHEAFYSKLARERNRPARIELARLTVRQYRQALADLVGSFRPPSQWGERRGLRGEYYSGRRFNPTNRIQERIDGTIEFDFGIDPPVAGKIEPHEFMIRWRGSVLAPDTGEYDIVIRTEHAARLWLNDQNRPFIDAWVKSGNDTEYKASVYLIGGRIYPLRLEFAKAKQGVDDSKKQKVKPPSVKATVALLWKRPQRVVEPIPARQLSPVSSSESYVCATPFPPDDRSYGWERGTTVSLAWDQAETDAAIETARYVVARLPELADTRDSARDRPEKLRAFCKTFAERAFRRPLTPELTKILIDKQFEAAKDPADAVKRCVVLVLKSPRFLYREVGASPDAFDVASRLSFGLWESLPDQELTRAAADGRLATRVQVAKQAERMLDDPRARAKLRDFLLKWCNADHGLDLAKDPQRFPGFDAAIIGDLRTSLELFLEDVAWSDAADFRELLVSEQLFLNGRLAKFYGATVPAEREFSKVKLDAGRRAGVLTHPYLMTSFAHSRESSPIHRGVFLARGVFGLSLRPPPEAVAPLAPDLHPNLTTRERVMLQTKSAACMSCHVVINPLGFTLENFDAVGRYRALDNGKPVDATGSYRTSAGQTVTLKNARELAVFLAGSEEAHEAFAEQMFHHLVQQPVRAYGDKALDNLRRSFVASGFNIRRLAVDVLASAALSPRDTKITAAQPSR